MAPRGIRKRTCVQRDEADLSKQSLAKQALKAWWARRRARCVVFVVLAFA